MSDISLANRDRQEYADKVDKMTPSTDKKFFFEGRVNKKYYQKINFFRAFHLQNGGNCDDVIKKVNGYRNHFGIIDGDFKAKKFDRVYQIDFYSIENIVVHYNELYSELEDYLKEFFTTYSKKKRIIRDNSNPSGGFVIKEDNLIDEQYHQYINEVIISSKQFIKYMDLKKVTKSFALYKLHQNNSIYAHLTEDEKDSLKKNNKFYRKYIEKCKIVPLEELFKQTEMERLSHFM